MRATLTPQDTKEAGVLRAELLSTLPSIAHFLGRLKLMGARPAVPMQGMADLVLCSSTTQVHVHSSYWVYRRCLTLISPGYFETA